MIVVHSEVENYKEVIDKLNKENRDLKSKNVFSEELNRSLKREILKCKAIVSNPVNF